ncbi:Wzz/FepE/Etk N-terminal domain-containing protein [Persephonella sp.]|uniref:Wzz/FepE/Etk N-terminal domain-containing protein n=1 Tax=Persephonella sp. TaxID=2060922 RepID=UPI00260DF7DF|nr:Wzz/FepE/Etk N-terminal domain-containing protein [Persephonella sp.]
MEEKKPVKKDQEIVYYQEDEIDLYELWLTLKKRWKVIASTTLIFAITAVVYIFIAKPVYTSSFFVKIPGRYINAGSSFKRINLISVEETNHIISDLSNDLREKNYKKLKHLLKLHEDKIKNIRSIAPSKIRGNKGLVKIEIESYKPSIIPDISKSLVSYLNSNSYVKRKIETEREKLLMFIKESKNKLQEMEKTKELINKDLKAGKIQNLGFNPLDLDTKILKIKKEIAELEIRLKNLKGFEISVDPAIPEKPSKPKKKLILAVSVVSGLFLGVFLAFFFEWIENASRRDKSG